MSDSFDELVETRPDSTPGGDRPEAAPPGRRDDLILSGPGGEPPEEGPAPPVRVGPFRVVSVLGAGAMGVVYRARHESSGREVALKLLKETANPNRLERIRREGELTARLKHPNVVAIHSAGDVDGQPWLAYELVEDCRTLQEVFPGLELGERVELLRDAARALGHAHALGICHRDVKPDNLLVDGSGRLRVADFGLAGAGDLERLTRSGDLIGTPLFMAPEQISGKRAEVGPGVDVWALGVILYEALTGELPFPGENMASLIGAILQGRLRPLRALAPATPAALEAICLKALHLEQGERYPDGAALADDLDRYLAGKLTHRGQRLLAWSALAGGLLVSALVGVVWWGSGAPRRTAPPDPAPTPTRDPAARVAPSPSWWADLPASARPVLPLPAGLTWGAGAGEYLNEKDRSVLVWVPPCKYRPRPPPGSPPTRRMPVVQLAGFFLGKYEVSRRQFREFERARGVRPEDRFVKPSSSEEAITLMTWDEANAYCTWAGLRLPTEMQWEYAAGGTDGRAFPWGNEPPGPARVNGRGDEDGYLRESPVTAFPKGASPFGCLNMSGNVREWVLDALTPGTRVVRGSGYGDFGSYHELTFRMGRPSGHRGLAIGFRVCRPAK